MQKATDYKVFDEKYLRQVSGAILADSQTEQFHHSAVAKFASEGLNRDSYVLDAGCGSGLLSFRLSQYCSHVIGVDVSIHGPLKAKSMYADKKIHFVVANSEHLPFKPGVFDCAVASQLFDHLTDEEASRAQKDIYRVLKTGGSLTVELSFVGRLSVPDAILLLLFSPRHIKRYYYYAYKRIRKAKQENPHIDFYHLEGVLDPTHRRLYDAKTLANELLRSGFGSLEFFQRRIFSVLFFNSRDLFRRYVKFYIEAPQIIRRLFLIDIGGRVRAVKNG